MAVSKRAQGSSSFSLKTVKAKRNGKKTKASEKIPTLKAVLGRISTTKSLHNWTLYTLVTTSVFVCYFKTFFGELVHDDIFAIKHNADILPSTSILDLFSHDYWGKPLESALSHKSFRPLSVLTFRAHFFLHGFNPFGYRLVNVLLHVAVCLLFVHVCQRVLACSWLFSFLSGLLFAVHPIHSEAVNAIVGRADILACLLFLLAFITYTNCIRSSIKRLVDQNGNKVSSISKWLKPEWKSLFMFNILGTAALFAKENGITVFGFCIMYDIMVVHECHLVRFTKEVSKIYKNMLVRIIILTSVASLLLYFRICLQNGELPQFTVEENPASYSDSSLTRLLTYSYLCFFNAWLLMIPLTLCYDWQMGSIPLLETLMDIRNLSTIIFFFALFSLFVVSSATSILNDSGERKVLLTGLLLLAIPFLPASNILFTVGFVVAERILYIPSLGYCLLINFGFAKLAGSSICSSKDKTIFTWTATTTRCKITAVVYTLMLACLSWKTWHQSSVWQTRGTLFRSGVIAVPQNAKVHYNYANYLKDVRRKTEAIHHYQMAVKLAPGHASAHNNLGTLVQDSQDAIKHFKLAIKYNPYHVNALLNLGAALSTLGKLNESEIYLRESFRLNPNSSKTLLILTDVLTKKGSFDEADKVFKDKILETPSRNNILLFNNYGLFLTKNEKFNEALLYFNKANTLAPEHSVPVINKANVFIAMRNYEDAETTLKKFLNKRKDASVFHHLASLYSKLLKYLDAEKSWQEALKIDPIFTDAVFSYVSLLKLQGRKEEAFDVINHFSKYQPKSIEVMQEVVNALHEMGYLKEALQTVENILAMSERPLVYYQKGNILKDLGLYQEAISVYNVAVNIDSKLPEVYVNLGASHHVLGNLNDAKMYYNYALTLDPVNKAAKTNLEKLRNKIP